MKLRTDTLLGQFQFRVARVHRSPTSRRREPHRRAWRGPSRSTRIRSRRRRCRCRVKAIAAPAGRLCELAGIAGRKLAGRAAIGGWFRRCRRVGSSRHDRPCRTAANRDNPGRYTDEIVGAGVPIIGPAIVINPDSRSRCTMPRNKTFDNVAQAIGDTPMIRINRLIPAGPGHGVRQVRILSTAQQREGPYRRRDDRGRRARRQGQEGHASSSSRRAATRASRWRSSARPRVTS